LACDAKYEYLFLAWDSPAKDISTFFSVSVPFRLFIYFISNTTVF